MERIKYYSTNDIMCGYNLGTIDSLINKFDDIESIEEVQDINDLIEVFNVKNYLDNEIYLPNWSNKDIKYYTNRINKNFGFTAKFFKTMDQDNIIDIFNGIQINYRDDFWTLIDKFNIYEKISEDKFRELLRIPKVSLYELLKHKKIAKYFGKEIKNYMLDNYYLSAELLLDKYEIRHVIEKEKLYIPKELSSCEDKEIIISKYIDDEEPNLNYLRLIANIQSNKDEIELSPKILLKAKKRAESLEKNFFTEKSGIPMETTIIFSDTQEEVVDKKRDGHAITVKYSTKWIKDNLDFPTLLNNFIYLFEYVDYQVRLNLVNKLNQMGVLERTLFTRSKKDYIVDMFFIQKNMLSLLQIKSYYNELFSLGIRLEEIIEWFFEEYLANEFNAYNFRINTPSSNSTMLEKCTNIMPALESVLKQFSLFVQEGKIDFELLEIRSEHLIYENIPSLVDKKYVYGIGEEYNNATFLFFSDQSSLGYVEKVKKAYNNFFELLCNEEVKINDFHNYCKPKINWLIKHNYLLIDDHEYINFYDSKLVLILRDLYYNEVISYWRCLKKERQILNKLKEKEIIEFESSLFSRPEQSYINYFLNKSQFNNGLDLRNKYSHTQPNIDNENIHNQNYMIFLRLFIFSVIKINEEFCISQLICK